MRFFASAPKQSTPTLRRQLHDFFSAVSGKRPMRFADHAQLKDVTDARSRFFTTVKLGPKRAKTPEGFLICFDVPICRTGEMQYAKHELPQIDPDDQGLITITRSEKEVFSEKHVASYNGKPVVNDHPEDDVTPLTWANQAVGTVINPRRGSGEYSDCIVADLVINEARSIAEVEAGKDEVSCGYDADYVELGRGRGEQTNLMGNHVALVDSGRCGSRCAISDHAIQGEPMKTRDKKPSWRDRLSAALDQLSKAVKSKDEAAVAEAQKEVDAAAAEAPTSDENLAIHLHTSGPAGTTVGTGGASDADPDDPALDSDQPLSRMTDEEIQGGFGELRDSLASMRETLDAIAQHVGFQGGADAEAVGELEEALGDEVPEEMRDSARKARDSAFLGDSFQETLALAEILCPEITLPTFDRALPPAKTYDAICKLRRKALDRAYLTPRGREVIEEMNGGKRLVLDSMPCKDVKHLFRGAASLMKAKNNADSTAGASRVTDSRPVVSAGGGLGPVAGETIAQVQARLNKHYGASN